MSATLSQVLNSNFFGALPVLTASNLGAAAFDGGQVGNRLDGFNGDGDYIELPISSGTDVEYFNAAGASQWTVSITDIDATADEWVGFVFDDDRIYIVASNNGTAPDTFYTASVNSAGTVTNIGNAQPSSDFTTAAGKYTASTINAGSSMVQRDSVGAGNLFVRQFESAGMQEMEINITTGAIVSDPAVIDSNHNNVSWKTTSGLYSAFSNTQTIAITNGNTQFTKGLDLAAADAIGLYRTSLKPLQWKNNIIVCSPTSAAVLIDARYFDIATFNEWVGNTYLSGGYA